MRRPFLVMLGLLVALGAYVAWSTYSTVSTTGPMISMWLKVSIAGEPLSPESIKKVEYCFSEAPASKNTTELKGELRTAWADGDSFVLNGPYSITRNGFSRAVKAPQFQSLFIRVAVTEQKSFVVSFPMISSTKMSGPLFIDLPQ